MAFFSCSNVLQNSTQSDLVFDLSSVLNQTQKSVSRFGTTFVTQEKPYYIIANFTSKENPSINKTIEQFVLDKSSFVVNLGKVRIGTSFDLKVQLELQVYDGSIPSPSITNYRFSGSTLVKITSKTNFIELNLYKDEEVVHDPEDPVEPESDFISIADDYSFCVGDVIFSDNTVLQYSKSKNYSKDDWKNVPKENAVAVIFKEGTYNNALGVGLVQSSSYLEWAPFSNANDTGYTLNFTELQSIPSLTGSGAANNEVSFNTQDTDGSDNWEAILKVNNSANKSQYPAFKFCLDYSTNASLTAFKDNWFLPNISELYQLYKSKSIVNDMLSSLEKAQLSRIYWSSSQYKNNAKNAIILNFSTAEIQYFSKEGDNTTYALAIRKF